jgi:hypothetical protein
MRRLTSGHVCGSDHFADPELWHRLLGRMVSESGILCRGDGTHGRGDRRRRMLMLATLFEPHCVTIPIAIPLLVEY